MSGEIEIVEKGSPKKSVSCPNCAATFTADVTKEIKCSNCGCKWKLKSHYKPEKSTEKEG